MRNGKTCCARKIIDLLDGVPQGTLYHPEFDALKHTFYVCKASITDNDYSLLESAFLHNIGKSTCTNIGRNRIYAFGHVDVSARFLEKYKEYITDFDLTYRIVKKHMDFDSFENRKLQHDIPLKFFIWADKTKSRELYLYESNKTERFINKCREKYLYLQQRFNRKKVILLIGISGSGKSTYVKNNFDPKYVVCTDEVRRQLGDINDMSTNNQVWTLIKSIMHGKLNMHGKVILDATNINKWLRIQIP